MAFIPSCTIPLQTIYVAGAGSNDDLRSACLMPVWREFGVPNAIKPDSQFSVSIPPSAVTRRKGDQRGITVETGGGRRVIPYGIV